ncbi:DNA-directed RNA polymerase subunit alpha [Bacillus sp. Brlt_9]|uniref:DNA-directed RNA polymerase subunit alpha n=1 Tax=Bacillus sp. Brlt_9 TaxID=3110916 RepID=UPI003F7CC23F
MNLDFNKLEVLIDKEETKDNFAKIYIEPLEKGFALTLGTALRRIMMSSMPGASVAGFRMEGVTHSLMTMPGTATDGVELVSRLKQLKFSLESDKIETLVLKATKPGIYTTSDLILPKGVELKSEEIELVNVTGEKPVMIEIFLKKGRGFVQAKEHSKLDIDGIIGIDGLFSPIKTVGFETEDIYSGEEVTHQRLILNVTTRGNIEAKTAVLLAVKILMNHLSAFYEMKEKLSEYEIFKEKEKEVESINSMTIEELKLSVRSTNALKGANIKTVGQLRKMTETEVGDLRNMGKTSVLEVKEILTKLNVSLGDY